LLWQAGIFFVSSQTNSAEVQNTFPTVMPGQMQSAKFTTGSFALFAVRQAPEIVIHLKLIV